MGFRRALFADCIELGMREKFEAAVARGEMYPIHRHAPDVSQRALSSRLIFMKTMNCIPYVMPRVYFDAIIQQHAVESGAEFRVGLGKGPLVEDGRVVGVNAQLNGSVKPIRSKMVVGADGVTSVISTPSASKARTSIKMSIAQSPCVPISTISRFIPGRSSFFSMTIFCRAMPGSFLRADGRGKYRAGHAAGYVSQNAWRPKGIVTKVPRAAG